MDTVIGRRPTPTPDQVGTTVDMDTIMAIHIHTHIAMEMEEPSTTVEVVVSDVFAASSSAFFAAEIKTTSKMATKMGK